VSGKWRVAGSITGSSSPSVEVSLSKTSNTAPEGLTVPCEWMGVRMGECEAAMVKNAT